MYRKKAIIGVVSLCLTAVMTFSAFGQRNLARNQVDSIIRNLETSSDVFSRDFKNRNTSSSERRIVDRFENAVDGLRRNFDRNDNWWSTRNDVQGIMDEAQQVNQLMNNERFARPLEVQWRNLRRDINQLAATYELPGLAGGGWNGGGGGWNGGGGGWNGGGGPTSNPPSWATGTFYSRNSADQITLNIEPNGRVTVTNNGQPYYGTFYRNQITVNGDVSDVIRDGNAVRTYNRSTGETTRYTRNGWGGGGGGWDGGGNTSRPPSWAQGTFYSTNGDPITMSIDSGGRVTLVNGGQTYYGSYYNDTITLNGDTSTVTQTRRGISTYNRNTGQTTQYRRQ